MNDAKLETKKEMAQRLLCAAAGGLIWSLGYVIALPVDLCVTSYKSLFIISKKKRELLKFHFYQHLTSMTFYSLGCLSNNNDTT